MPTAGRHDVDGNAGVEEQGLVGAAEIMQAEVGEAEQSGPPQKLLRYVARCPEVGERNIAVGGREVRKHQGFVGKLYQGEIDLDAIRDTGLQPLQLLAFGAEQGDQVVVDRYGPLAALCLWTFDRQFEF
jgi:hypothetical protein